MITLAVARGAVTVVPAFVMASGTVDASVRVGMWEPDMGHSFGAPGQDFA